MLGWRLLLSILLSLVLSLLPVSGAEATPKVKLQNHHHPITTSSVDAQQFFDQGLLLTYGFNQDEAVRAFQAAIQADPDCALCYWGIAYALGPNINAANGEDGAAWKALQQALQVTQQKPVTPGEVAYIQALAQRYPTPTVGDRPARNRAYASAMRQLVHQYPDDLDAATLLAEALMDTTPWDYWQADGSPKSITQDILATLESVLKRQPNHPGALHFYIHTVEQQHPEWAIAQADRLRDLHLPLGHLAHMPSHIYSRIGRYQDAIAANQQAIAIDQQYAHQPPEPGIYTYAYMPHNHHFLWYAAMMAGQEAIALKAAQDAAAMVDPVLVQQPGYGTLQHFLCLPLYTRVKFGQWEQILAQTTPPAALAYPTGVWRYARGMALVAQGDVSAAQQELQKLEAIASSPALDGVTLWDVNPTANLLQIGAAVLAGELAAKQGQLELAVRVLQKAVDLEDHLKYDEPPPWYSPTRQALAAVLLEGGRLSDSAQMYQADLAHHPGNVWSLQGLSKINSLSKRHQEITQNLPSHISHAT